MIATSSDLADIVAKGNVAYENLSPSESLRYGVYVQSFFDNVESYRSLVIDYEVDKNLTILSQIVRRRTATPGFNSWWRINTDDYDPEFVSWVDDLRDDN